MVRNCKLVYFVVLLLWIVSCLRLLIMVLNLFATLIFKNDQILFKTLYSINSGHRRKRFPGFLVSALSIEVLGRLRKVNDYDCAKYDNNRQIHILNIIDIPTQILVVEGGEDYSRAADQLVHWDEVLLLTLVKKLISIT